MTDLDTSDASWRSPPATGGPGALSAVGLGLFTELARRIRCHGARSSELSGFSRGRRRIFSTGSVPMGHPADDGAGVDARCAITLATAQFPDRRAPPISALSSSSGRGRISALARPQRRLQTAWRRRCAATPGGRSLKPWTRIAARPRSVLAGMTGPRFREFRPLLLRAFPSALQDADPRRRRTNGLRCRQEAKAHPHLPARP